MSNLCRMTDVEFRRSRSNKMYQELPVLVFQKLDAGQSSFEIRSSTFEIISMKIV